MNKKIIFFAAIIIIISIFVVVFVVHRNAVPALTLREKLCQLMMPDFKYWGKDKNGNELPFAAMNPTVKGLISKYQFGGIILFTENMQNTDQTIKLISSMQNAVKIPLLIGTDQEGSLVSRIKQGTNMPGNMVLGAANDYKLTKKVGKAIGGELKALGINVDFAPVLDIALTPLSPIGVRSFGSSPEAVSSMGESFISGLKDASILSCVKHFPGLGNTHVDTHLGLATLNSSYNGLLKTDLKPFEMCIKKGANMVMVAHVIVPSLDNGTMVSKKNGKKVGIPAIFSHKIISGLLRDKFKFKGVIITDALDMGAIKDYFSCKDAVVRSILAGADIVLMPVEIRNKKDIHKLEKLLSSLVKECKKNPELLARVNESVSRILKLKKQIHLDRRSLEERIKAAGSIIGCRKYKQIADDVSSKGITLIKNDDHMLPFRLQKYSKILLLDDCDSRMDTLAESIKKISSPVIIEKQQISYREKIDSQLRKQVLNADFIILDTYNFAANDSLPEQIVQLANNYNKKLVTIACRNPYDVAYIPDCKANFAIYGATSYDITNKIWKILKINLKTVSKMIFVPHGASKPLLTPTGKLPVEIQNSITGKVIYNIGYGLTYN